MPPSTNERGTSLARLLPVFFQHYPANPFVNRFQSANTTSWKRPEASLEELSKLQAAGQAGEGQGVKKEAGGDALKGKADGGKPSPLPAGWTEVKDPKSGKVYFWNQVRGWKNESTVGHHTRLVLGV